MAFVSVFSQSASRHLTLGVAPAAPPVRLGRDLARRHAGSSSQTVLPTHGSSSQTVLIASSHMGSK
eukprot:352443-Chlamydomonas_euryale.AAC.1